MEGKNLEQRVVLQEMFETEAREGARYSVVSAPETVEGIQVPTTKDKKPDASGLIAMLGTEFRRLVSNHFKDGMDPSWILDHETLQNVLKPYSDIATDSKLRHGVREPITNAYAATARDYVIRRAVGRTSSAEVSLENAKAFGIWAATETGRKELISSIKGAKTNNEVGRLITPLLGNLYDSRTTGYSQHKNFDYTNQKESYKHP